MNNLDSTVSVHASVCMFTPVFSFYTEPEACGLRSLHERSEETLQEWRCLHNCMHIIIQLVCCNFVFYAQSATEYGYTDQVTIVCSQLSTVTVEA